MVIVHCHHLHYCQDLVCRVVLDALGGGNEGHFRPFHSHGLGIASDHFGGSLPSGRLSFLGSDAFVLGFKDCGSLLVIVE